MEEVKEKLTLEFEQKLSTTSLSSLQVIIVIISVLSTVYPSKIEFVKMMRFFSRGMSAKMQDQADLIAAQAGEIERIWTFFQWKDIIIMKPSLISDKL